ncbi:acyl carrier protein [Tannockella kyphosi]|uniref:acyl carrier protein n=1 Tax=Tannockella kyphosi TaxID=2899121 RepID=UPI0020139298|nr:acyl carrier protein [Tannockella kyphosi]
MELDKVKKIIVDVLKKDDVEITLDTNLREDLNADSLDAIELIMAIEEEFDVEIDDEVAVEIKTVRDFVEYLEKK